MAINIAELKTNPSKFIKNACTKEPVIICSRNTPVAELKPLATKNPPSKIKLGLANGKYSLPENFNETPEDLIDSFYEIYRPA